MTRTAATAIGFTAILLWALLALFTVGSAPVPPFMLNALCFGIGGVIGLFWIAFGRGFGVLRGVPLGIYAFGTVGLFGYHALYFSALRMAPAAEAGLIAYLWPLFIVLLSGLLPGERLTAGHVLGALAAFAGVAMIALPGGADMTPTQITGLGLAFMCAITWSIYSVASRRMGAQPSETVVIFCLATAVLSTVAHLVLEVPAWPRGTAGWVSVAALGIGPVGIAFFTWDIGMKKGDIQFLGVASYAAPLLSTLALVLAGIATATPFLLAAAVLITGGAMLAARASRRARPVSSAEGG